MKHIWSAKVRLQERLSVGGKMILSEKIGTICMSLDSDPVTEEDWRKELLNPSHPSPYYSVIEILSVRKEAA